MNCLFLFLISLFSVLADNEPELKSFVNSDNLFTISLYKQIVKHNNVNFLISPYSAVTVLAFAQSGCNGETAQEIRNSLQLPDNDDKIESGARESIAVLKGNDRYTFHSATKLYVKNGFAINNSFKKAATEVYGADVENIQFVPQDKAAKTMNQWVETQTNNRIRNTISPAVLDEHTQTVIINTIYFKGNWTKPFSKFATRQKDFYKTNNDVVKVDTLHEYRAWFSYYKNLKLDTTFVELPFKGREASMIIALPNQKEGLGALENNMAEVFAQQNFTREFLNVALPKFKVETTVDLVQTLKSLGVRKAFDSNEADLSSIAGKKSELVISDVLQKAFIDVQEDGVEGTAGTYVPLTEPYRLNNGPPEPRSKDFIADHPFIFYIKVKNLVIFAGRISDPSN